MTRCAALILCALFFSLVPVASSEAWLIYHKPEFMGKVIDAETKEPIEGAVVVVTYKKTSIGPAESYSNVIDAKEALTDNKGEFHIPSYTTVIQPLSWTNMANFIIYKPGYGSFPDYQTVPAGIKPKDEELFFSKDVFNKDGELELWVKGDRAPDLKKFNLTFGIVELPKLKTSKERLRVIPGGPTDYGKKKLPLFYKAINEEYRRFGLDEVGDY